MNYCGIDIAKRKHSAMIINTKRETVKQNFTFKNDRQGFDQLLDELEPFAEELMIALEADWALLAFPLRGTHNRWIPGRGAQPTSGPCLSTKWRP